MNSAQLAQDAMVVITPLLPAAAMIATKAAGGFAGEAGKGLFTWLVAYVKSRPAETTLERAVAEPASPTRLQALQLEIQELAEKDAAFREKLNDLVKQAHIETYSGHQSSNQQGDNNKNAQATGSDIKINIG